MNYQRIYLLLTQLGLMHLWWITNIRNKYKSESKKRNIFLLFFYTAWTTIFFVQIILGPILAFKGNIVTTTLGLIIYSAGVALAVWSKFRLGKSWGLPEQHNKLEQKELVIKGPYKFSRNPIYLSELIMLTGFELSLNSFLIILIIPFYLFNRRKVIIEEKILENIFGLAYLEYKTKVHRFI